MDELFSLIETILRSFAIGQSPQAFLVLIGLAFARLLAFLQIVPFFGGSAVPARVKVATATAFVIIVYPSLAASLPAEGAPLPFGAGGFMLLLVKEAAIGFTLGFLASLIFEAIQMAGRIIDFQRGAMMGELYAPQLQLQVSVLGQFKLQLAIVIFLMIGAHRAFIGALLDSFALLPPTRFPHLAPGWSQLTAFVVTFTGQVFAIGVQLAAPAMIALLLTELLFGIINRVAPQINVFFLSLPVKMAVGIAVVALALGLYQERYIHYFKEAFRVFEYVLRAVSNTYG